MKGFASKSRGAPCDGLLGGTARIFAAEALLVPTGIATAAFLSRRFGPEGYGLLTLASVLVVWVETFVSTALSRPAIKLVGDAGSEWQAVGTSLLRLYTLAGLGLASLLWAAAPLLAHALGEPELSGYLRLLALDVPLFCAAQAHRNIIVGTGRFRERAYASAARWIARLVLVIVFVEASGSPVGALWGSICASLVELMVCRRYARPRMFMRGAYPARRLCLYALPLVASALCVSLFNRLDLIMLKALGGTSADAGVYGVAQNLALLPSLFSFSLAPALLSTLSRALREGDDDAARETGRQSLRAVFLLLPFAALAAGAAHEIVGLIFGADFLAAVPLVRLLIFGALALLLLAVTTSVLTAAGKPLWTFHLAWPLLPGAAAHLFLIPRAGAVGAAFVTTALACAAALASVALVRRLWRITPHGATLWRSAFVSLAVYALAALVPAQGVLLILKLAGASLFVAVAFVLLGEFSAGETEGARALFRRRRVSLKAPGGL